MTGQFEQTMITGEFGDAVEPDVTVTSDRMEVRQSGDGALGVSKTTRESNVSSTGLSESFNLSGTISLSAPSDSSTSSITRMRRKQTFWTSVAHIGQQVASALQYAHDQGAEARRSIFDYIERFYNRVRRHSALGGVSPEQYEQAL